MGQGALPFFPGPHCLAKPSRDSSTQSLIALLPCLSPARPEGSQKVRRNEEGHLVVRSVCYPVQGVDLARKWQLWDPVPVHPKAPAGCTPDGSLHLGLMLL